MRSASLSLLLTSMLMHRNSLSLMVSRSILSSQSTHRSGY
jgi:hypothetical protein